MADTDLLPARGVPALALVDSTGIASNGSQTVAQLAARGIRSVCAVDANGVSVGGSTVAQLASSGIRAFCPVDENGLAQDAVSTADILRRRGIRPMVLLNNTGVALTGSANVLALAQRGLQSFCPVDEAGNATTMGAVILISNTTVLDTATIGSNVGTLSVAGGTGTYTFTLTSNPGSLFATAGTNGVNLNVAAALTAGIKPITVQAAGGVPTPISRTINITVTQSPTLPVNTVAPVIAGTPQEGQTLTVTNNGTWTGFPAPGFTYQWNRALPVSAEVAQWLARATGFDAAHIAADTAFIDGLVADGLWSKFDALWVLATQNSTTALLNMVSSSYACTAVGAPTFTVDRGYVGQDNLNPTAYLNTHHNPLITFGTFTTNNGHLSAWSNTNITPVNGGSAIGSGGGAVSTYIVVKAPGDSKMSFRINGTNLVGPVNADSSGHYLGVRSAGNVTGYRNATAVQGPAADTVSTPLNGDIFVLALSNVGAAFYGGPFQISMASIGGALTATDATNFYNRLRTRLTAVGVP